MIDNITIEPRGSTAIIHDSNHGSSPVSLSPTIEFRKNDPSIVIGEPPTMDIQVAIDGETCGFTLTRHQIEQFATWLLMCWGGN